MTKRQQIRVLELRSDQVDLIVDCLVVCSEGLTHPQNSGETLLRGMARKYTKKRIVETLNDIGPIEN